MAITMKVTQVEGGSGTGSFTATKTASDTTTDFAMQAYAQATIQCVTASVTGTSPTLNIYVQKKLPDGTTYQDIASFTQFTGNATRIMHLVSGGNLEEAGSDGGLANGTVHSVPFGTIWRFKLTIGGTNPSFGISCYVQGQ